MEDWQEKIARFKKNYVGLTFIFIIGIVLGVTIALLVINVQMFLILANLVLTAMVLLKMSQKRMIEANPEKREFIEIKKKVCPECGSATRHKKGCSLAKKK